MPQSLYSVLLDKFTTAIRSHYNCGRITLGSCWIMIEVLFTYTHEMIGKVICHKAKGCTNHRVIWIALKLQYITLHLDLACVMITIIKLFLLQLQCTLIANSCPELELTLI